MASGPTLVRFWPRLRLTLQLSSLSMVAVVIVTDLVKQFGRFAALRGVTAEFAPGRLYAVLGDNGAGKTTLLRALAGLTPPTRGSISMLGATNLHSVCSQVGYMAHPSLLYDEMSGMENLRYFARLYDVNNADQRCADVIRAVKLDPTLARPVGQYSQGMRQRMSLARALLNDPKILASRRAILQCRRAFCARDGAFAGWVARFGQDHLRGHPSSGTARRRCR